MKNLKKFMLQKTGLFSLLLLMIVVVCISFVRAANEDTYYKSYDRSNILIEGSSNMGNWSIAATSFACDGQFVLEKGELQELSELNFALPVNQLRSENPLMDAAMEEFFIHNQVIEIRFKQTNAMVLSVMKMANVIGELQIGNKQHRVALQLSYVVNKDQSLTFRGTQSIKLSDYQLKMPEAIFGAIKSSDEVKVSLSVTLSNEQIALLKSQDLSR
jgi:polyisoprenoid-binding protein YceI